VCVYITHTHTFVVVNNKMCDRPWIKWSELPRRVQGAKIRIGHNVTFYMFPIMLHT